MFSYKFVSSTLHGLMGHESMTSVTVHMLLKSLKWLQTKKQKRKVKQGSRHYRTA